MEVHTRTFETPNGLVEGVQTRWPGFNVLMVTGSKGFLACPAIDVEACERYGVAAALVESTPDNPIGTLERFPHRKIVCVHWVLMVNKSTRLKRPVRPNS